MCWRETWHTHWEMYTKGEDLVEGHMEEGEVRLHGGQGVNIEEDIRIGENSWGQQETPIQWMLIEEGKKIRYTLCVENGAIWPKIVGREREEREG